jgi:hypothetical protein
MTHVLYIDRSRRSRPGCFSVFAVWVCPQEPRRSHEIGLALYSVEAHTNTNISNMGHWRKFKLTHYPKRTIEDKIILLNVHSTWTCVFDFCCWNFAGTGKA